MDTHDHMDVLIRI